MSVSTGSLERLLKRDRSIIFAALLLLVGFAWAYLLQAQEVGMERMRPLAWTAAYFTAMYVMWAVMMVGMMLPSAVPMILLYASLRRRAAQSRGPFSSTALFSSGYLLAWAAFSCLAVLAQWALSEAALLTPMMVAGSTWLGGLLFLAAGLYQLTPLKEACLAHCRAPLAFLINRQRPGRFGPLLMGLEHGLYCLGCCWLLMLLLFALGVMNLLWVAALTLFVLAEKTLPGGRVLKRAGGALSIGCGLALLFVAAR